MAHSATLNPTISPVGPVVLVEPAPYDFTDDSGKRVTGTSYKLHMLTDGEHGTTLVSLKCAGSIGADLLKRVKPSQVVTAIATGFARAKGRGAVIEYTVREVIDANSGEVIVRQA